MYFNILSNLVNVRNRRMNKNKTVQITWNVWGQLSDRDLQPNYSLPLVSSIAIMSPDTQHKEGIMIHLGCREHIKCEIIKIISLEKLRTIMFVPLTLGDKSYLILPIIKSKSRKEV